MSRDPTEDDGGVESLETAPRQVVAVAVLFAVLGGALVRVATVDPPPAALWAALGLAVVAAVSVLFGLGSVGAVLRGPWR